MNVGRKACRKLERASWGWENRKSDGDRDGAAGEIKGSGRRGQRGAGRRMRGRDAMGAKNVLGTRGRLWKRRVERVCDYTNVYAEKRKP